MRVKSAGVLLYKREAGELRVLLVHPGGPFWAKKDAGAWSIPKGEYVEGEEPEAAARREFEEELGVALDSDLAVLGEAVQPSRKRVIAFAAEGDLDIAAIRSNSFEVEWPPKSGRKQSFPEVDRAGWFTLDEAREKMLAGQRVFLDRLCALLEPPHPEVRSPKG
jgi:predicted NUDIX family NTP pyrophosphohydrolase